MLGFVESNNRLRVGSGLCICKRVWARKGNGFNGAPGAGGWCESRGGVNIIAVWSEDGILFYYNTYKFKLQIAHVYMLPLYVPWVCIIACILMLLTQYRRGERFAEPADFYLRGDGSWSGTPMVGASLIASGSAGFVPAPHAGSQGAYLRGDGTWATQSYGLFVLAPTAAGGATASIPATPPNTRLPIVWNTTPVFASGITCRGPVIKFDNPGIYMMTARLKITTPTPNMYAPSSFVEIAYSPNGGTIWIATVQGLNIHSLLDITMNTMVSTTTQSDMWRVQYQYSYTTSGLVSSPQLQLPISQVSNSLTIYRVA